MAQKFIIARKTGDVFALLRLGNVGYHRDLLMHGEECLGGGFFTIYHNEKKIMLHGKSSDFGRPYFNSLKYLSEDYKDYQIEYYITDPVRSVPVKELAEQKLEYVDWL